MKRLKFMKDRYGFDMLFLAITALCLLIALLTRTVLWRIPHLSTSGILGVTGLTMLINVSRVFSKDITRREAENIRFTLFINKLIGKGGKKSSYITNNKGYTPLSQLKSARPKAVYCECGCKLDVPQGSGIKIVVCPVCGKRSSVKNR
ncbi:hypothetical protein [Ruminococcus albus]|uniref:Uncharacterized protein n=1 Tax=Ruminococcus albus TaxID=1264 RepID=A0A1I1P0F3_RUMAL|nr:hypothetical protein [Ruminococcus albus]SFD03287.1 hypothetical protein SAMN02910406_02923 [Ruminococcus albus]